MHCCTGTHEEGAPIPIIRVPLPAYSPHAQAMARAMARGSERSAEMWLAWKTAPLEKQRKTLLVIQRHLATTRKPRIGDKEAQRLATYFRVPVDFFLVQEPKAVTKTRVDLELTRLEAEIASYTRR
jgi:hypothetical protein